MPDESFSLGNHPTILVMCAVYHSVSKGREPVFEEVYDLLYPLITKDDLKKTLKQLLYWGTLSRSIRRVDDGHVSTYQVGAYVGTSVSGAYSQYWLDIELEKVRLSTGSTRGVEA